MTEYQNNKLDRMFFHNIEAIALALKEVKDKRYQEYCIMHQELLKITNDIHRIIDNDPDFDEVK